MPKRTWKSTMVEMREICHNADYVALGFIQALFESVLCLFVFLWTPVLDHHNPPIGMVFASIMTASRLGGYIFDVKPLPIPQSLTLGLSLAFAAVLTCGMSTEPTNEFPIASYIAFMLFELASGFYFPTILDLKRTTELDKFDHAVKTWFRVPTNLLACAGLLYLHSSTNATGTKHLFYSCAFTLLIAVLISVRLLMRGTALKRNNVIGL